MHRRHLLIALAAFAAAPCAAYAQAESPDALVRALYEAHLRTLEDEDAPRVLDDPALLRRFLTPTLAAAIQASNERARQAGELLDDTLDFDPLSDSQDPLIQDLEIRRETVQGDRALVIVRFSRGDDDFVTLNFRLARVAGAWRVYDILKPAGDEGEGWSLREILRLGD